MGEKIPKEFLPLKQRAGSWSFTQFLPPAEFAGVIFGPYLT